MRPEWTTKHFRALTSAAKLPLVHLHDLRHSAASMASMTAGVPMKVVQGNLGHSTIAVTANVYSHVTTDLARDSAERVAAAIATARAANRM
ncbi:MAG: tyrosine-type recombinase/integrase [Acidimicrobiales bacterium]